MTLEVTRRNAIRLALLAGAAPLALRASSAGAKQAPVPIAANEGKGLTSYVNSGNVTIRWNNFDIATYRTSPLQKYPYFSQLAGPITGIPLTTESSVPFPHHRGVWLGCDPLNGGDYWTDTPIEKGQIRSIDLQLVNSTATSIEILNRCQWVRSGASTPCSDKRRIVFQVASDHVRWIDFDITLTALELITIAKAKHSFFSIRVAPDLAPINGGKLENSAGDVGEAATFGKPANWCGYWGRRAGNPNAVEGIAVMDHPENPWNPCPWFTRDYGHLSPSPFNFLSKPWVLAASSAIRLRYRVVLHAGSPQEANLDQLYREWIA